MSEGFNIWGNQTINGKKYTVYRSKKPIGSIPIHFNMPVKLPKLEIMKVKDWKDLEFYKNRIQDVVHQSLGKTIGEKVTGAEFEKYIHDKIDSVIKNLSEHTIEDGNI